METGPPRKKNRLANACELCRKRKVRCDDRQPDCTNCVRAGLLCTTTDPRHPHRAAERHEAGSASVAAGPSPFTSPVPDREALDNHTGIDREDRLPSLPRFQAGHASFILTQWLDMALGRLGLPGPLCWLDQSYSGSSPQGFINIDPHEGTAAETPRHTQLPIGSTRPAIYAVLPLPILTSAHSSMASAGLNDSILERARSVLVHACAVSSTHGLRESLAASGSAIAFTLRHLGWIMTTPSPLAVQVLVILSLQLRACDRADVAWHVITLAISIAQVLSLHRRDRTSKHAAPNMLGLSRDEIDRIWWCIYVLERTLSVELERHSNIHDKESDIEYPCTSAQEARVPEQQLFVAAIRLAGIQGQVMDRLLQNRVAEEGTTVNLERTICDKVRAIGHLDAMLQQWASDTAYGLRPDGYMDCDPALLPGVAHMALQFHTTTFLLHRQALIVNEDSVRALIAQKLSTESFRHRLSNARGICSYSTRTIVAIVGHLHENAALSLLLTPYSLLLAVYGLAVHIISKPSAVTVRSDAEIQNTAIAFLERQNEYMRSAGMENLAEEVARGQVLRKLCEAVNAYIHNGHSGSSTAVGMLPALHKPQRRTPAPPQSFAGPNPHGLRSSEELHHLQGNEDTSAWSPVLFSEAVAENDFDWEAFANAFCVA